MQSTSRPSKVSLPFANSGTKNTIPVPSQIGVTPGAASYTDGFPPLTFTPLSAAGVPPSGADFNGILNAITAIQQWQSAGGLFAYDSAFSTAVGGYPKGAVLVSTAGTGLWVNTTENNATNPDTGGAGWLPLSSAANQAGAATYAVDTGTANNYTVAYTPAITAVTDGMAVMFRAKTANTGASTFTVNGLTATAIYGMDNAALTGGEIVANGVYTVVWNTPLNGWVMLDGTGGYLKTITPASTADNTNKVANTAWVQALLILGFAFSWGTNGYIKLPSWLGGFTIQWGLTTSIPGVGALTVTLPVAYANAQRAVMAIASANTGASSPLITSNYTTTTFLIDYYSTSDTTPAYWLSIGN